MIEPHVRFEQPPSESRVVAVTGARTFLGTELIKRLEEDPRYHQIIALDIRRPDLPLEKTIYREVDLTIPEVDQAMAYIFTGQRVDTVVHAAFLSQPTHATEWAHELEDIGTMHVLNACAAAQPARFIMASTTLVYGAAPDNPNFLVESDPLRTQSDVPFIADKVHAEEQVRRFAEEHPGIRASILRFAPILGPTVYNMYTRFFARPMALALLGHDPLLQFVHESDAVTALKLAVDRDVEGPFNIVGHGVLPYRTVLAMMGRMPIALPHVAARSLCKAMWLAQLFDVPPRFLDFLRYLCVADGNRAQTELGFHPRFGIRRTVLDFLGVSDEDGAPDPIHAQG